MKATFYIGLALALAGFGLCAPCYAELVPVPAATQERQPSICPFLKLHENHCSDQQPQPFEIMDGDAGRNVWADSYASADKCQLWWWAHNAKKWGYAPLTEWAELLQDSLREGVSVAAAAVYLHAPPRPPKAVVDGGNVADGHCRKPNAEETARLNQSLKQFSSQGVAPDLMEQLVQFCMAHEVALPPWKRLGTQIQHAYVIPIGTTNFVVFSEPRTWDERALASVGASIGQDHALAHNIIGECPVTQEPRACVEGMIKQGEIGLLNNGAGRHIVKLERKMKAVQDIVGLEGLLSAHLKKPYEVTLSVQDGGDLTFTWNSPTGKVAMELANYNGELVLTAPNPSCDVKSKSQETILLRPLAFGLALEPMLKNTQLYSKDDFPAPNFSPLAGSKHACSAEPSYGAWAAAVANAAKHYAAHGASMDQLFRFIAYQRGRWDIDGEISPPRSQKDVIYGAVREKQLETPIFNGAYEAQAMRFITGNPNSRGKTLLYRTTKIDNFPATEVWYYKNAVPVQPLDPKSRKTNFIVVHNDKAKQILERSVYGRLNTLANNCAPAEEVKGLYVKAIYALFNAVPLQAGEEVVNRVFVAATYQSIFGQKMKEAKKWGHVSIDAWTMDLDTFAQKYIPLL